MTHTERVARSIDLQMYTQGKSTNELANVLGVSQSAASLIRNGKTAIKVEQLYIISEWLHVSTDELHRGFHLVSAA